MGNRSCRLLQYNIITTKTYRSIFFHYLGEGSESGLVGVWIVWNLEPLASGGQSGPKLVPHIICQFLYAWEKKSEWGDQVPTCPVFARAKIMSRFGILVILRHNSCKPQISRCILKDIRYIYETKPFTKSMPMKQNLSNICLGALTICLKIKIFMYKLFSYKLYMQKKQYLTLNKPQGLMCH